MNFIKSIFLLLISLFIIPFISLVADAASSFSGLETQIHSGSNTEKIKKMQLFLKELGIYNGKVDGIFSSVESSLLEYQKSSGIIREYTDYGAGYFGVQTLSALEEDFPEVFEDVAFEYLQMDEPSTNVRKFYITAYYSPLPGQSRYTTGSYAGDIRLNGSGKITASGKGVFTGILAAPRNYDFGTKIEFEGLGVGVVEDRGGAIVNSGERGHEYDRIDIWMGYGDEGLERALKWGKREVVGKVVPSTREVTIEFGDSILSDYSNLKVDAENPKEESVRRLQELFTKLELYNGGVTGKFADIKNNLIDFQIKAGIISNKYDEQAGYFGSKTIAALRKSFQSGIFKEKNNILDEDVALSDDVREKVDKVYDKIVAIIDDKYGKDTSLAIKYRKDLRILIDKQTVKLKSDLRKKQLKYLKSLL